MTYSDAELDALWEHIYFRAAISRNNVRNWWVSVAVFLGPIWFMSFPPTIRWLSLLISIAYLILLVAAFRAWKKAKKGTSSYTSKALLLITGWNGLSILLMSLGFFFAAIGLLNDLTNGFEWVIWAAAILYLLLFFVVYTRNSKEIEALIQESPGERFGSTRGTKGLVIGVVLFGFAFLMSASLQDYFPNLMGFVIFLMVYACSLLLFILFVAGIHMAVVVTTSGLDKSPYDKLPT